MAKSTIKICGVVPAFNSESTIARVVKEARRHLQDVLVIDDGSTDDTARLAEDAGANVIRVLQNKGKGNALHISFRYALANNFDAILTIDADLQHDPSEIPKFIAHYEMTRSTITVGNRMHSKEKFPRRRYVANRIGTFCFSWLIGQPVEDSQCGFRLYDRKVMENIRILNNGFEAEADILLRAGKRGYTISFVPVKTIYFTDNQHQSFYRPVYDTFRICIIFLRNLFWKDR
ncbi:MAG: glycosyltransferase family 2 protein [Desulfobacterales bacterium]|uniref:Glycosyltransferase family 2 protein n=1 Tax=Candidatus Desulfatibia profunda TaxID=2841695 RepID=A0A8J6NRB3_9BACT|nr:glycosyltransferase family 2 protein [Candidatus Desulfatibia profunda]MBL7179812.1 glycosyltransferase family 2 protein [Desulfobacterales bacterium]